jgi:hypothetical protein
MILLCYTYIKVNRESKLTQDSITKIRSRQTWLYLGSPSSGSPSREHGTVVTVVFRGSRSSHRRWDYQEFPRSPQCGSYTSREDVLVVCSLVNSDADRGTPCMWCRHFRTTSVVCGTYFHARMQWKYTTGNLTSQLGFRRSEPCRLPLHSRYTIHPTEWIWAL